MDDEPKIIDAENWKKSSENFGYKEIVLKQVSRIATLGSKELTAGWWKKSISKGAVLTQSYISDGRESYCKGVEVLHDILLPKFDEETNKELEEINKELKEINENEEKKQKKINRKLIMMRSMFQKLCYLLERLGWFEDSSEND